MGIIKLVLDYKKESERLNSKISKTRDSRERRELEIQRDIALDRATRIIQQFPDKIPEPYIDWIIGLQKRCPDLAEIEEFERKRLRRRKLRRIAWTIILAVISYFLFFSRSR